MSIGAKRTNLENLIADSKKHLAKHHNQIELDQQLASFRDKNEAIEGRLRQNKQRLQMIRNQ